MMSKNSEGSTKELIRNTALNLFQEFGFESITINKICETCNITKRTFYYHFKSKNDILSGFIDNLGMKAETLLLSMTADKSNIEVLWDIMNVYSHNGEKYGPNILKQVYLFSLEDNKHGNFPENMYLFKIALNLIEKAKKNNEIKNTASSEDIAFTLYHTFRSISITWAFDGGSYNLTERFKRAFNTILNIN